MVENASSENDTVLVCRLKIPLPRDQAYIQRASERFPEVVFEVNGYIPYPDSVLLDLRLTGLSSKADVVGFIRSSPDVRSVEILRTSRETAALRIMSVLPGTSVIRMQTELKLIPNFPVSIQEGTMTLMVAGTGTRIRQLVQRVREEIPETDITAVRKEFLDHPGQLLTPHQLSLFRTAISSGYWDVPRRVTLTDLASLMNVSKSTISETLASIEKKLLHEAADQIYIPA
ncbi:MAG: helix-turn-helix domain-containing protein [Candidatus Thermoplasmatota archaeon]|jgi:predicted DNA binding protein|nr:helix-turn-helix domain-containing protein [Candidatus Thermoplasmatota archaeon]MCL5984649.1 helix-turn-helix domain-containing protein [Candidatus Thermoplasmatota archaeon]